MTAVKGGAKDMPPLDPFIDIDMLELDVDDALTVDSFPESGHVEVNYRNIDSDSDYDYDDENEDEENNTDFVRTTTL